MVFLYHFASLVIPRRSRFRLARSATDLGDAGARPFVGLQEVYMGVEPKIGVGKTPQIIPFVHKVWNHYFHHPFWGVSPYSWKHPFFALGILKRQP